MEQEDSMKQASLPFRSRKKVPGVAKVKDSNPASDRVKETHGDRDMYKIASITPEKPDCRSRPKGVSSSILKEEDYLTGRVLMQAETSSSELTNNKDTLGLDTPYIRPRAFISSLTELPEKYKTLSALFNRMDSSIRLLSLKKKMPTFQNIKTQVEILSERKFLSSHLAQMKYAFPEAIQIEKILIHDDKSLCMMPDMKITLVQDVVGCHLHHDQSISMALCKAFHARLLELINTHSEDADIPQAELPEPFNTGNEVILKTLPNGSQDLPQENFIHSESSLNASHLSSSYHKKFPQKLVLSETQKTELLAFPTSSLSISMNDDAMETQENPEKGVIQLSDKPVNSSEGVLRTPGRMVPQYPEITPSKYSSAANTLMAETPVLQTPKRPVPSTEEKHISEDEELLTGSTPSHSVRRSLIYSPSKADGNLTDSAAFTPAADRIHEYSCRKITGTRNIFNDGVVGSPTSELQIASDAATGTVEDHLRSKTDEGKGYNQLTSLLNMVDTICLVLRSAACSFITKQELVHKIILNNLDIEETREVEEQLQLLEALVPDFISKTVEPSGDCLYSVKHMYDRESILAKFVETL